MLINQHFISFLSIFFLVSFFSIKSELEDNSVFKSQNEWEKLSLTTSNKEFIDGRMPLVLHDNLLICLGQQGDSSILYGIDVSTGTKVWYSKFSRISIFETPFIYKKIIALQNLGYTYGIDISSGKVLWKNKLSSTGGIGSKSIGQYYFHANFHSQFFIGKSSNGQESVLWNIPPKPDFRSFSLTPLGATTKNKDTLVILPYTYYNEKTFHAEDNFSLYNIRKKRIIYTQNITPLSRLSGGMYGTVVYQDHVYFATGFYFACHRLKDGKQVWRKDMPKNIGTIAVADGRFIGSANNGVLYCFDAFTGKELWQRGGISSMAKPLYMNGVFYATNSYLYAVDAQTGTLLWKKESPDKDNSQSQFYGNVVGANGKIYASSFLNLYCFKAAK